MKTGDAPAKATAADAVTEAVTEAATDDVRADPVVLRPFRPDDLDALVAFWNEAFAAQRNFAPVTAAAFTRRVLACPAFDPGGLILAWQQTVPAPRLVGLVHAFKPPPLTGLYRKWEPRHHIAVLYVTPALRRQGIGSRLLQAAQNWLYYCPVHVADHLTPCYGSLEGPRAPFFGSTERMGIPATARGVIQFFAAHGYKVDDPGDVSMTLHLDGRRLPAPAAPDLARWGLRALAVDNAHPFRGTEPDGREEYSLWCDNGGDAYGGLVLVDEKQRLRAHVSWYPLADGATMALGNFWVAPPLRGHGLGAYLLDAGLHAMSARQPATIELHTHLVHHTRAVAMYERRGFQVDMAWVNLVKT